MVGRPRKANTTQLQLFTRRPVVPTWTNLPPRARHEIQCRLAQLIRRHAARLNQGKESNER